MTVYPTTTQRTIPALTWQNLNRRANAIHTEYDPTLLTRTFDAITMTITHIKDKRTHELLINDCKTNCSCPFYQFNGVCAHSLGARKLCIDAKVWTRQEWNTLVRKESFLIDKAVTRTPQEAMPFEVELANVRKTLKALETRLELLDCALLAIALQTPIQNTAERLAA